MRALAFNRSDRGLLDVHRQAKEKSQGKGYIERRLPQRRCETSGFGRSSAVPQIGSAALVPNVRCISERFRMVASASKTIAAMFKSRANFSAKICAALHHD
jgi:hypothetical protein